MSRHLLPLAVLLVLSACKSPTSPEAALKTIVDNATPDIKVNGVTVPPGSTTNVTVGNSVSFLVTYLNHSGQDLNFGLLLSRDDGVERLESCGSTPSGGGTGGFGSGTTVFPNDTFFKPGRTVRVLMIAALGPAPSGPGQCLLQLSQGQVNRAAVQTERLLATLAVQ